jgi:hypothetical protein
MILLVAFLRRAIFGSCVCATKLYVRAVPASSYFYSMHVSVVATCVPAGVFITFSHVLMFLALDELEPVPLFPTLAVHVCLGMEPVPPRPLRLLYAWVARCYVCFVSYFSLCLRRLVLQSTPWK